MAVKRHTIKQKQEYILMNVWVKPDIQASVKQSAAVDYDSNMSDWLRDAITEKLARCEHAFEPFEGNYRCAKCGIVWDFQRMMIWSHDQEDIPF